MAPQYRGMTEQQRWIEYGRIKREWTEKHGYSDPAAYDAMVKKACEDLEL
jgi:hypothetical protein